MILESDPGLKLPWLNISPKLLMVTNWDIILPSMPMQTSLKWFKPCKYETRRFLRHSIFKNPSKKNVCSCSVVRFVILFYLSSSVSLIHLKQVILVDAYSDVLCCIVMYTVENFAAEVFFRIRMKYRSSIDSYYH